MKVFLSFVMAVCLIGFSTALVKEVDLFKEVSGLTGSSITVPGVSRTTGKHGNSPALLFNDKTSHLIANAQALADAGNLIRTSHDFVVSAYIKINPSDIYGKNPILSISSQDGQQLYFLVAVSSSRRGKLALEFSFYTTQNVAEQMRPISRTSIDVTQWHKIELRVQDTKKVVFLFVDGELMFVDMFQYKFPVLPSNAQLRLAQLYVTAGEGVGAITERFMGALQDVKIALGQKDDCIATTPAPCKCPVPGGNQCIMGGVEYKEGDQWRKDNCTKCLCRKNEVICLYECQTCNDGDKVYLHGDTWHPSDNKCQNCKCESGKKTCVNVTASCPTPNCSGKSGRKIIRKELGECCPICVEDQCKGTGKVYKACGCPKTCTNYAQNSPCTSPTCKEGCFCPTGFIVKDEKCVSPAACECFYNGNILKPGELVSVDKNNPCQMCMCVAGKTKCLNLCGKK